MSPVARLVNAQVRYNGNGRWIPRTPISLTLEEATSTLLIGPSGCGKSTISLTLDGVIPHSIPSSYRGSVLVSGTEVADSDIAALASRVGIVMQDPDAQIVTGRVWDEVCYALQNLRLAPEEITDRASRALRLLRMEHLAERDPWTLSGGQRQRIILAGALALEAPLLVLDEPTANLDPAAARDFHDALFRVVDAGTSVLIVEHNLDEIAHRVDTVIALDANGATIAAGAPEEVFCDHARELIDAGIRVPASIRLGVRLGLRKPALDADTAAEALASAPPELLGVQAPRTSAPLHEPPDEGADAPTARLTARGLDVHRGKKRILEGIDLDIRPGETIALLGANGSGKSTLLRTLIGLEAPSSGSLSLNGEELMKPNRARRLQSAATLVTQNPEHQFVTSSTAEELSHSMRLAKLPRAEISRMTRLLLDEYGLAPFADSNPFTLSGGQKRRLSVAAALAVPRDLLLLDEPTFGQDEASIDALIGRMRAFARQGGAVLFATHDLELAASCADRIIILSEGRIGAEGSGDRILGDARLLETLGLVPTALHLLCRTARRKGVPVPAWTSWRDVPDLRGL